MKCAAFGRTSNPGLSSPLQQDRQFPGAYESGELSNHSRRMADRKQFISRWLRSQAETWIESRSRAHDWANARRDEERCWKKNKTREGQALRVASDVAADVFLCHQRRRRCGGHGQKPRNIRSPDRRALANWKRGRPLSGQQESSRGFARRKVEQMRRSRVSESPRSASQCGHRATASARKRGGERHNRANDRRTKFCCLNVGAREHRGEDRALSRDIWAQTAAKKSIDAARRRTACLIGRGHTA